jgi:hypothetical protein
MNFFIILLEIREQNFWSTARTLSSGSFHLSPSSNKIYIRISVNGRGNPIDSPLGVEKNALGLSHPRSAVQCRLQGDMLSEMPPVMVLPDTRAGLPAMVPQLKMPPPSMFAVFPDIEPLFRFTVPLLKTPPP